MAESLFRRLLVSVETVAESCAALDVARATSAEIDDCTVDNDPD